MLITTTVVMMAIAFVLFVSLVCALWNLPGTAGELDSMIAQVVIEVLRLS